MSRLSAIPAIKGTCIRTRHRPTATPATKRTTSIRGSLPRSVNTAIPNGIGKPCSLSTTTIRPIRYEGSIGQQSASPVIRDIYTRTRRLSPALPATKRTTSIRGSLPRSVNAAIPNGIGKPCSLSTITIPPIRYKGNIEPLLARVATRDCCIRTRRPRPATLATRKTISICAGWVRNVRTATAYEIGNSGTSITIRGLDSSSTAAIRDSIVMPATVRAWTRKSNHRPPVSVATRKMTSMKEVSALNVTGVMKQPCGRRSNGAAASFAAVSLRPVG